jgi:hypothetical protein
MSLRHRLLALAIMAAVLPEGALAASGGRSTVTPTKAQRAGILKAFGDPPAAAHCLITRLAAANHNYGTVRFNTSKKCLKWEADGVNIFERVNPTRWRERFEGSSYKCPLANIPKSVQRDLGVCPYGA